MEDSIGTHDHTYAQKVPFIKHKTPQKMKHIILKEQ